MSNGTLKAPNDARTLELTDDMRAALEDEARFLSAQDASLALAADLTELNHGPVVRSRHWAACRRIRRRARRTPLAPAQATPRCSDPRRRPTQP